MTKSKRPIVAKDFFKGFNAYSWRTFRYTDTSKLSWLIWRHNDEIENCDLISNSLTNQGLLVLELLSQLKIHYVTEENEMDPSLRGEKLLTLLFFMKEWNRRRATIASTILQSLIQRISPKIPTFSLSSHSARVPGIVLVGSLEASLYAAMPHV